MAILLLVALTVSILAVPSTAQTNTPPGIVINPPKFTTATPGQTIRITCVAYGFPVPSITWSRLSDDVAEKLSDSTSGYKKYEKTTTVSGKQFRVSVLEICGVSTAETDEYFCTASNGISGTGIAESSYAFFVSVLTDKPEEPPSLVARPPVSGDSVMHGSTVEAVCVAYGNPVPAVTWSKQGCVGITCINNAQVFNQVVSYGDVVYRKSTLQLCNIDESNSGTYMCSADNGVDGEGVAGAKSFTWQLSVNPKPVISTSDVVIPTTTCPGPPTVAYMTSSDNRQASNSPQPSVGRTGSDDSGSGNTTLQAIAIVEGVLIVFLIIGVVIGVFMIIVKSRNQGSKPQGSLAAMSTGFREQKQSRNDEAMYEEPAQRDLSYSNLVKKMESED